LFVSWSRNPLLFFFWNPNVHYRAHNSPPPVRIVNRIYTIRVLPAYFFKIHFNILPSMSRSYTRAISFKLSHQNPVSISPFPHTSTAYGLDGPGIESRWRRDFPHLSRPVLRSTQPPVQWVPGLSPGVRCCRGVTLTPHPLLVPRSKIE